MRVYRALLHLYPKAFRVEYGEEMVRVFARRRRDASSLASRTMLWFDVLMDVVTNAAAEHLDMLRQDLRYAARTLGRSPGFTATALAVVALGVGANTAVFSVADRVFLRPLPFAEPDRLVKLWQNQKEYSRIEVSPSNYRDWKRMARSFEMMADYANISVNLVGEGTPERIEGASMTSEMLPLLGVQPFLGRFFTPEEDRDGATGTVLLSYALWQGQFGGDRAILGRHIRLDNEKFTVIGVMPPDFHFPSREAELWIPMRFGPDQLSDRTNTYTYVLARLKRGITLDQARAETSIIARQLEQQFPKDNAKVGITVRWLRDEIPNQSRILLWGLVGAAGCVLLIACTNFANLLLSRTLIRQREFAVRSAIGAGRERIARQVLTESMLLALGGGALGIALAAFSVPFLVKLLPDTLNFVGTPTVDSRVLAWAALLTTLTGILFGCLPALDAGSRPAALRDGARSGSTGMRSGVRSALVVAQITACVVLLVSSGLLLRAMWRLQGVDPGFHRDGVMTMRTALPLPKYDAVTRRADFYRQVLDGARAIPGVTNAAYISFLPMTMRGGVWVVEVEGHPVTPGEELRGSLRFVTPGFFDTVRVPLLRGRDVSEGDGQKSPYVAVVSESFARQFFPGEDPIGRKFKFAFATREIVGIVGNIRVRGLERESEPQVYLPYRQVPDGWLPFFAPKDLVVRTTAADPTALTEPLRRIIQAADREQPISNIRTLAEIVRADTSSRRSQIRVLGLFTGVAIVLAAIGMYGLLSFAVSQRFQEIGVRVALGAQPSDIMGLVMREAALLAGIGTVLGVAGAYSAGKSMEALLAGVQPADPVAFGVAVLLAVGMTLAGSLGPALRALAVDPIVAMRVD